MAKQLINLCDKCGEPGDDVRTFVLRQDGRTWEIDLDERHAAEVTIAEVMITGREQDLGIRRGGGAGLDHRIRGVPAPSEGGPSN